MAIGWKCQYGYMKSGFYDRNTMDDFVKTDDGYFFFSDTCNLELPLVDQTHNVSTTQGTKWYNSSFECSEMLEKILGENFYSWYVLPGEAISEYERDKATMIVPSIFSMCPNLLDYFKTSQDKPEYLGIYFPTLKKIIYSWQNSFLYVRDVKSNGETSSNLAVGCYLANYPGMWYQAFFSMLCFTGYDGNVDSLFDIDKMFLVQCSATNSPDSQGICINKITNNNTVTFFRALFKDFVPPDAPIKPSPDSPNDPYEPGGGTEPGGGGGDFDDTSIPVDIPDLPTVSASDTGFIRLYNPTIAQLQELSSYMWSDLFNIDGWKKIFANPMDAILGLSIVPVSVPGKGVGPVKVGNISTGVSLTVAATQYVSVDCGEINVKEYWGAYLDYDPYTKAEIYLPYIGTHAISVDDIMSKTVHVVYHVDILSGACCAYVKCGESVLYSFVGQCSCSIPITGSDWTNVINGALTIAGSIGSMVATGGASAPTAIGTIASAAVNSLKPNIEKSGSMGGMGGIMGIQVPYLILTRPRQALPSNQNRYTGYPSFMTISLGDCAGYTEIESVHLEGIPATQAEISEIETLLKGGVIF